MRNLTRTIVTVFEAVIFKNPLFKYVISLKFVEQSE